MERTILTGAMLIDGSGAPPAAGRAVVVQNGRIAGVVAERDAPAGRLLRLDGLTLPAGLINCHVHLCLRAEADPAAVMLKEPYAAAVIKAVLRAGRTPTPRAPTGSPTVWRPGSPPSSTASS